MENPRRSLAFQLGAATLAALPTRPLGPARVLIRGAGKKRRRSSEFFALPPLAFHRALRQVANGSVPTPSGNFN